MKKEYFFLVAFFLLYCAPEKELNPYRDENLWLCKPGIDKNYCYGDLTATEILPDGSKKIVLHILEKNPEIDCFYVYPTVDITGPIGNHTDFSDVSPMLVPLMNQAARFNPVCAIYAPLYKQITLMTFASPDKDEYLEIAYNDVLNAFKYYLDCCNNGRRFVLMGHSQGSILLRMLIQREFESNDELRNKLLVALLIGGDVLVPEGGVQGETFKTIPLCTSVEETGCVIAYRSYAEGYPPKIPWPSGFPPGTDSACVNPAGTEPGWIYLSGSYFPAYIDFPGFQITIMPNITTSFFLYRNYFRARCTKGDAGSYLEISSETVTGDVREIPIPVEEIPLFDVAGLHMIDYNLALEDLIQLVRIKSANPVKYNSQSP